MKAKITLSIAAAALITLSFTFVNTNSTDIDKKVQISSKTGTEHVVGFISDEVVK